MLFFLAVVVAGVVDVVFRKWRVSRRNFETLISPANGGKVWRVKCFFKGWGKSIEDYAGFDCRLAKGQCFVGRTMKSIKFDRILV